MVPRYLSRIAASLGAGLALACVALPASALQPLSFFLEHADSNPDNREAMATVRQREAEASSTLARLLPSFSARGVYTRNQYGVSLPMGTGPGAKTITVQPQDQLDGSARIDVPIVDLGTLGRARAQEASAQAASASRQATRLEVQKQVVRSYYQAVAAKALVDSAHRSLDVAQQNANLVRVRSEAGTVSDLDVQRAQANIERARQDLADAELTGLLALRNLETLTGMAPSPVQSAPTDDLHEEGPLASWLSSAESTPSVAQAQAQVRAAEQSKSAAQLAYLPTLTAGAQERWTNASGFAGKKQTYAITATLSWGLDFTLAPNVRAQAAAADAARARADRTRRAAQDAVHESWQRVRVGIAKSQSARAQESTALSAESIAQARYENGSSTQLDVIQAQRDAFAAQVARIQADADLSASRALLRLTSGRPVSNPQGSSR